MSKQTNNQAVCVPGVMSRPRVPLLMKIVVSAWVVVMVPVWVQVQGWANFLWLSDIALFTIAIALWFENRLLVSMAAIGTVVFELGWNFAFFGSMLFDEALPYADYMFREDEPRLVRCLSLFHTFLPLVTIYLVSRLGYDGRALWAQTIVLWLVLAGSCLLTTREANVNFVYGIGSPPEPPVPRIWWVAAQAVGVPLLVQLPMHQLMKRWRGNADSPEEKANTQQGVG